MGKKIRVQVYLDPEDYSYVNALKGIIGLRSDSEAVRFALKLLRMVLPRANLVVSCVLKQLEESGGGYT